MPGFVSQSQLGPYFVAADVFVMPSLLETWGLVVDEAMHFGLPVVTGSMVGSHQDLIVDALYSTEASARGILEALGLA